MLRNMFCSLVLICATFALAAALSHTSQANGAVYYVSSSAGNDSNVGSSIANAFRTVGKVNSLKLQPGDKVLFKCGDTWRAEQLVISKSGTETAPIVFGSFPEGCADKPVLSGSQPIAGWAPSGSANIYVAHLSAGANGGRFSGGINQLFRNGQRLTLGRWPNLNEGDGGYFTIDAQPSDSQITDSQLPTGDWSGAVAHIRGMRWYILNRQVTGNSGSTLTLGAGVGCWGSCAGWGYFLNNHLNTLDQEGEWYYDAATHQLYLYTTGGAPANDQIEGSVILKDDDRSWGGIMLGQDLTVSSIAYVIVENLDVRRWFRHGIASPTNLANYENHHITLRNNTIADVDGIGLNLMTWVYDALDSRPDGWRGGYNMTISGNTIAVANSMGINTCTRQSAFADNTVRDVGLIANLGAAGMGCGFDEGEGDCTEDGDGIRIKIDKADDTGNYNTVTGNRLERIAYNGMDVFGHHNTFEHNVILQACYTKGDCGGVRTFGRDNLTGTPVHDLLFNQNMIVDTIGNTDGCHSTYQSLFGFGLYIDNYSRDVTLTGNTIISSTSHGILYQNSTGSVTGNTLYNNNRIGGSGAQVFLGYSPASISQHNNNVLYSLRQDIYTLALADPSRLGASDRNYFFNPYRADHIQASGGHSLTSWKSYSGKDGNSKEHWFTLNPSDPPNSRIFYNATQAPLAVDLGDRKYLDLDQNTVVGSITLSPFTSKILIDNGQASLTLLSMNPTLWGVDEAGDFSLTVSGAGFTSNSVVRWNGAARPTAFVSGSRLTAAISATDVSIIADIPVTVYDPTPVPTGTETLPLIFHVVQSVSRVYLPVVFK